MLSFDNTRDIVPFLKGLLEDTRGFITSSGNSTGLIRYCNELRGTSFRIEEWNDRSDMMQDNGLSTTFAEFDIQDRLSKEPVNPGKAIQFDETGVLSKYIRADGTLRYTYSERVYNQIPKIVKLLKEKPSTRQAFISIWDPCLDIEVLEIERVPCSIGFQFLIRDGKMDLIYYMRSLEVSKCLGNDIYTSTRFLEEMAKMVCVDVGTVTFSVGSLHVFK